MAKVIKYSQLFFRKIFRPVGPFLNPLLKTIKSWQILIGLLTLAIIGNFEYGTELIKYRESIKEKIKIEAEIKALEKILEEKKYYRDILLRISLLAWQIKDEVKAKEYFKQTKYLDPNSQEVKRAEKIIFSLP